MSLFLKFFLVITGIQNENKHEIIFGVDWDFLP